MQETVSCGSTVLSSPASQWMFGGLRTLKLLKLHTPEKKADTYIKNQFTERLCCKQKILQYLTLASSIHCLCKLGHPSVTKVEEPRGSMYNL